MSGLPLPTHATSEDKMYSSVWRRRAGLSLAVAMLVFLLLWQAPSASNPNHPSSAPGSANIAEAGDVAGRNGGNSNSFSARSRLTIDNDNVDNPDAAEPNNNKDGKAYNINQNNNKNNNNQNNNNNKNSNNDDALNAAPRAGTAAPRANHRIIMPFETESAAKDWLLSLRQHPSDKYAIEHDVYVGPESGPLWPAEAAEADERWVQEQAANYTAQRRNNSFGIPETLRTLEDVTMITQGTPDHLHEVARMASLWLGPLHVAMFVTEDVDYAHAVIDRLLQCSDSFRRFVRVHFVFPREPARFTKAGAGADLAAKLRQRRDRLGFYPCETLLANEATSVWRFVAATLKAAEQEEAEAARKRAAADDADAANGNNGNNLLEEESLADAKVGGAAAQVVVDAPANYNQNVPYPVNVLRNVPRSRSATKYFITVDIDLIPSPNLRNNFLKRIAGTPQSNDEAAWVIPVFEIDETEDPPKTKRDLEALMDNQRAQPFYAYICRACHAPTNYTLWFQADSEASLSYNVAYKDPWEPFYVSVNRRTTPYYDDRFKQYGFNRVQQICELFISGHQFRVLTDGYLCHSGIKMPGRFHASRDTELNLNRILYRKFKTEMKNRYPGISRRC
eukprot:m.124350 g.124350  ORF g.124350 m.124350 type:complete len:620 (-) comp16286_c0_seq6:977-2836(-)